jgi:hypothetical protein
MSPTSKATRALLALLLLFFVAPARAENEEEDSRFELKYAKTLNLRGGRVTVDHRFGDLDIRTHGGSDVDVRATIRSSDADIGKQIRIVASEEGGNVSVRTVFPDIHWHRGGHLSYSVDMSRHHPAERAVTAKNQFGSIDVRGLHASSIHRQQQGAIEFATRAAARTRSRTPSARSVDSSRATCTITNSNGQITCRTPAAG